MVLDRELNAATRPCLKRLAAALQYVSIAGMIQLAAPHRVSRMQEDQDVEWALTTRAVKPRTLVLCSHRPIEWCCFDLGVVRNDKVDLKLLRF